MSRLSISITLTLGILSTAPKGPSAFQSYMLRFTVSPGNHIPRHQLGQRGFHDTGNPGPTDTRLSTEVPSEHEVQ